MVRSRKTAGFTVVEVVMAVALVAVSALALGTMHATQVKNNSLLAVQITKTEIARNVLDVVDWRASCNTTFSGIRLPSGPHAVTNLDAIRDEAGNVIYQSNSTVNNIDIGQMTIVNRSITGPSTTGLATVTIPIAPNVDVGTHQVFKPIESNLIVSVNSSWTISNCGIDPQVTQYSAYGCRGCTSALTIIPGTWKLCTYSGYRTTGDDSNIYDACYVEQVALPPPATGTYWRVRLTKHSEATLTCYANCMNY